MSELIREALRHYERRSYVSSTWDEVNAYGRAKARAPGHPRTGYRPPRPPRLDACP
jgi:hypothetical protein